MRGNKGTDVVRGLLEVIVVVPRYRLRVSRTFCHAVAGRRLQSRCNMQMIFNNDLNADCGVAESDADVR